MIQPRWTKRIQTFLAVVSLVGCQGIPKPVGHVGVIHVKDVNAPYIHEYDMQTDFDDDLHIVPGHNGTHLLLHTINDLDKYVAMSSSSYANALAAYAKLKQRYQQCLEGK